MYMSLIYYDISPVHNFRNFYTIQTKSAMQAEKTTAVHTWHIWTDTQTSVTDTGLIPMSPEDTSEAVLQAQGSAIP